MLNGWNKNITMFSGWNVSCLMAHFIKFLFLLFLYRIQTLRMPLCWCGKTVDKQNVWYLDRHALWDALCVDLEWPSWLSLPLQPQQIRSSGAPSNNIQLSLQLFIDCTRSLPQGLRRDWMSAWTEPYFPLRRVAECSSFEEKVQGKWGEVWRAIWFE